MLDSFITAAAVCSGLGGGQRIDIVQGIEEEMRVDLRFQEGEFGFQFLVGDVLIALFRSQPLVDHPDTRAENKDQQEDGDIGGVDEGPWSWDWRPAEDGRLGRDGPAKDAVIDAAEESIKNQEDQDQHGIGYESFVIEQTRKEYIGIQVIEGDDVDVADEHQWRQEVFHKKIIVHLPGTGIEQEWQRQEA